MPVRIIFRFSLFRLIRHLLLANRAGHRASPHDSFSGSTRNPLLPGPDDWGDLGTTSSPSAVEAGPFDVPDIIITGAEGGRSGLDRNGWASLDISAHRLSGSTYLSGSPGANDHDYALSSYGNIANRPTASAYIFHDMSVSLGQQEQRVERSDATDASSFRFNVEQDIHVDGSFGQGYSGTLRPPFMRSCDSGLKLIDPVSPVGCCVRLSRRWRA